MAEKKETKDRFVDKDLSFIKLKKKKKRILPLKKLKGKEE